MEAVTDLDRLIEHRARQARQNGNPERPAEAAWAESVRRYNAKNRKQIRREWYAYFRRIAESLRRRAEEYDQRAEALMEGQSEVKKGREA